jgi:hypothetical protein
LPFFSTHHLRIWYVRTLLQQNRKEGCCSANWHLSTTAFRNRAPKRGAAVK